MAFREVLLAALRSRFGDGGFRTGTPPDVAVFTAAHPQVGDISIRDVVDARDTLAVTVVVGEILVDHFVQSDSALDDDERSARLTRHVVRFLEGLFTDRLLLWRSVDRRYAGWRERGNAAGFEPLVVDNRTYERYLWSGPLSVWQAIPAILARGQIRDDRDCDIVLGSLNDTGPERLDGRVREIAEHLVADHERSQRDIDS